MGSSRRFRSPLVLFLIVGGGLAIIAPSVVVSGSNLGFGGVVNLSKNPASCQATCSSFPLTVAGGSHVYFTWLNNTSGNSNILFVASSNNGSSFGPIVRITNSSTANADHEQIANVGSYVYLVWQQNVSSSGNNILFRASANNGTTFGPVITVLNVGAGCGGGCTISTSSSPGLAAVGNNVYVAWLSTTNKGANEILFKASTTNGSNLATVTPLTISNTAYGTAQPRLAATAGFVYIGWNDFSPTRAQTFFAASSNSGTSFAYVAAHTLSSTSPGETDLYQEIATAGSNVYVTWTNDTLSSDNTMFAASTNNGASFTTAVNLNKGLVTDLNPELAASGNSVYVVWSDAPGTGNTEVDYRASSNNGASFGSILNMSNVSGTSNQQMITSSGSNVDVTWVQSSAAGNGVYFLSSSDSGSTFGSPVNLSKDAVSSEPAVSASGTDAFVAWEDDSSGNGDIYSDSGTSGTVGGVVLWNQKTAVFNLFLEALGVGALVCISFGGIRMVRQRKFVSRQASPNLKFHSRMSTAGGQRNQQSDGGHSHSNFGFARICWLLAAT